MEGQSNISGKLKFKELKKIKTPQIQSAQKAITAANSHNLIFVCSEGNTVKALSNQVLNGIPDSGRDLQLLFKPTLLTVARYGYSSTLLVIGQNEAQNYPVIEAFDVDNLQSFGKLDLSELSNAEIVDYAWNPNYFESIVALCTNRGHLLVVAADRKTKGLSLVYNNQQYGALTCCWSPKGKNIAIGMNNGKIFRLEPVISASSFTFKEVANSVIVLASPKITPDHQVVKLRWLNKTFLLSAHAKCGNPNGPDTIYSVITVKPSKPFCYWSNVCFENHIQSNYTVHLANLTNTVICSSNASSEAAAIGVSGSKEAKSNELKDWYSIIIDEEGARVELPLDANNRETYPLGLTTAYLAKFEHPILLFYSSDGHICPYAAIHSEGILKLPEFQQPLDCPISIPKAPVNAFSSLSSMLSNSILTPPKINLTPGRQVPVQPQLQVQLQQPPQSQVLSPPQLQFQPQPQLQPQPQPQTQSPSQLHLQPQVQPQSQPQIQPQTQAQLQPQARTHSQPRAQPLPDLSKDIKAVRVGIKTNQEYSKSLEEVNQLRTKLNEILDMHTSYKEVFQVILQDIDSLDLGMLENLYLISYIRSVARNKHCPRPLDPMLRDRLDKLKRKTAAISDKLSQLNDQVDRSWENSRGNKKSPRPLEMIYQTLATNHKIISLLKKKASSLKNKVPEESHELKCEIIIREPFSKQESFRELLASRSQVPVRR